MGLVVSSVVFALTHGSTDPWLAGYVVVFSLSAGLLAIISAWMEAPIAHHVATRATRTA